MPSKSAWKSVCAQENIFGQKMDFRPANFWHPTPARAGKFRKSGKKVFKFTFFPCRQNPLGNPCLRIKNRKWPKKWISDAKNFRIQPSLFGHQKGWEFPTLFNSSPASNWVFALINSEFWLIKGLGIYAPYVYRGYNFPTLMHQIPAWNWGFAHIKLDFGPQKG